LRWPICIFNLVDITKLPCYPHRRRTTVSLETFTLNSSGYFLFSLSRNQNESYNHSINNIKNTGDDRCLRSFSYAHYLEKYFIQIYRASLMPCHVTQSFEIQTCRVTKGRILSGNIFVKRQVLRDLYVL